MEHPDTFRRRWNHPSHPHRIVPVDGQRVYAAYEAKWKCDVCRRVFDARRAVPPLIPVSSASVRAEESDNRYFHHCNLCKFDVCSVCFKGRRHTFHSHRLKKARASLIYPSTEGQWYCDACKTVHSENTELLCYHCDKCKVDMCTKCFEGKWEHILHNSTMSAAPRHTLRPVDPRIEYRIYERWICDNCNRTFSCEEENTAFHCDSCNFDLCEKCFGGEKQHLHAHSLALLEAGNNTNRPSCSECKLTIQERTHYRCRRPSCNYFLCVRCFSKPPQLHPSHEHPLHVCNPLVVYPQSGGMWHCDSCTANSYSGEPVPLNPTEIMYHCELCEFDLCHACYTTGFGRRTGVQEQDLLRPVQASGVVCEDTSPVEYAYPSSSSHQSTYFSNRLRRPLVTGVQAPLSFFQSGITPRRLCDGCRVNEATTTFAHGGTPHSNYVCCNSCAADILSCGKPCPICGVPPDEVVHKSLY